MLLGKDANKSYIITEWGMLAALVADVEQLTS
jgi:hypothetical protein